MTMNGTKIWIDGVFYNWDEAKIHVLTHAFHYGTGVFEGVRCYKTDKGYAVFRLHDHIRRLVESGKMYFMSFEQTDGEIERAVLETIRLNGFDEWYIRPIAYYGYGKMGVNPLPNKVSISIALWKWDEYFKSNSKDGGIRVMTSSWLRIDNRSMPMRAKATANYANSALARVEAIRAGYDEAIMLNIQGKVVEGTAENIFTVKDNTVITPPISAGALDGITRNSILTICKDYDMGFEIRDLARDELYSADEAFLSGTAAHIKPITEVDSRMVGSGRVGKVTKKLQAYYEKIVRGKGGKLSKIWLTYVK
jgi:branched-chain amino acid aminotransferase